MRFSRPLSGLFFPAAECESNGGGCRCFARKRHGGSCRYAHLCGREASRWRPFLRGAWAGLLGPERRWRRYAPAGRRSSTTSSGDGYSSESWRPLGFSSGSGLVCRWPLTKGECPRDAAAEAAGSEALESAFTYSICLEGPRWPCAASLGTRKAGKTRAQKPEKNALPETTERVARVSVEMLLTTLGLSLPRTGERAVQRAQSAVEERGHLALRG